MNDYAIFGAHVSRLGRFSRPDPIPGCITDRSRGNVGAAIAPMVGLRRRYC